MRSEGAWASPRWTDTESGGPEPGEAHSSAAPGSLGVHLQVRATTLKDAQPSPLRPGTNLQAELFKAHIWFIKNRLENLSRSGVIPL